LRISGGGREFGNPGGSLWLAEKKVINGERKKKATSRRTKDEGRSSWKRRIHLKGGERERARRLVSNRSTGTKRDGSHTKPESTLLPKCDGKRHNFFRGKKKRRKSGEKKRKREGKFFTQGVQEWGGKRNSKASKSPPQKGNTAIKEKKG